MLLMPLLLLAAAAEANVIQDTLEKDPQPPWQWVRGERDMRRMEEGTLQIRAQSGTLWKADRNDAKNLLVRPWPAEAGNDAIVSVKVRFAPERGGEQAGVMLYFGDDDYVKIVRESLEGKRWIVMGREEKGTPKQIAKLPEEADEVTLYLTRNGDTVEGYYRVEGRPVRPIVGNCPVPVAPMPETPLQVALFAHGGPPAAEARLGGVLGLWREEGYEVGRGHPHTARRSGASTRVRFTPPPCRFPVAVDRAPKR